MIVKNSILFRDYAKISDQRFQFFSSMRVASVNFLIIYRIENFQKTFDLLSSIATHAINDQKMNCMIWINISIILDTKHWTQIYVKQNFNKKFDFNQRDVVSWFWIMSDLNFFQIDFDIDVFNNNFKKKLKKKITKIIKITFETSVKIFHVKRDYAIISKWKCNLMIM